MPGSVLGFEDMGVNTTDKLTNNIPGVIRTTIKIKQSEWKENDEGKGKGTTS